MDSNKIGNYIVKKREEIGLSSTNLARILNTDNKLLLKWESGKAIPNDLVINNLATVFNTTIDSILNGED